MSWLLMSWLLMSWLLMSWLLMSWLLMSWLLMSWLLMSFLSLALVPELVVRVPSSHWTSCFVALTTTLSSWTCTVPWPTWDKAVVTWFRLRYVHLIRCVRLLNQNTHISLPHRPFYTALSNLYMHVISILIKWHTSQNFLKSGRQQDDAGFIFVTVFGFFFLHGKCQISRSFD